jgi:hypothetical protein
LYVLLPLSFGDTGDVVLGRRCSMRAGNRHESGLQGEQCGELVDVEQAVSGLVAPLSR